MNLTSQMDFHRLCEKVGELHGTYTFQDSRENVETYYVDVNDMIKLNHEIREYVDFTSPLQIKEIFSDMWSEEDERFLDVAKILSVAAIKNRENTDAEVTEISPYIYEF